MGAAVLDDRSRRQDWRRLNARAGRDVLTVHRLDDAERAALAAIDGLRIRETDSPAHAVALTGDADARRAARLALGLPTTRPTHWHGLSLARPLVMGIVNVTPDSFSDGGNWCETDAAVAHARQLVAEGADVLDIGGESTRPGAAPVDAPTEIARVVPVIAGLQAAGVETPISIDTAKAEVADAALAAGATIVNDVSALGDPAMAATVARHGAGLVLMHMQGEPRTMQADPRYADLLFEVTDCWREAIARAEAAGVAPASIAVDPGIGFGKTLDHNLELLRATAELASLGYPLLIGTSRKSFVKMALERVEPGYPVAPQAEPTARVWGTAASVAVAVADGAQIVRVHDVAAMRQVADLASQLGGELGGQLAPHGARP